MIVDCGETSGRSPPGVVVVVGESGKPLSVFNGRLRVMGEEDISGGDPVGPGLFSGTTLPHPAVNVVYPSSVIPEI
jgi:hypothetical protein